MCLSKDIYQKYKHNINSNLTKKTMQTVSIYVYFGVGGGRYFNLFLFCHIL